MIVLAMADILASPLAFELCEGDTNCDEPKTKQNAKDETIVSCPQSDKCAKGDCSCQLFKRAKGTDDAWELPRMNHDKEVQYKSDKFDYKCLCVKPILEHELKIQGVKYTTRFVLCGLGTCSLDKAFMVDPNDPTGKLFTKQFKCTGDCEGDCKCALFRLQIDGDNFNRKDAKWEYAAAAGQTVRYRENYFYRCFCLK